MRLKKMMPLFLVALTLLPLDAFSWGGMKNKKGKAAVNSAAIQTIRERNIKRKAERSAILAAQEQAAASRSVVGASAAAPAGNPLSNVTETGAGPAGLCYTVCSGAKISHPCGVAPRCQNTAAFVRGCTNSSATNYNPNAKADDGSCQFNQLNQQLQAQTAQPINAAPSPQATCKAKCNGFEISYVCGSEPYCPANPQVDLNGQPSKKSAGRGASIGSIKPPPKKYQVNPSLGGSRSTPPKGFSKPIAGFKPVPGVVKPSIGFKPLPGKIKPSTGFKPALGIAKPIYAKPMVQREPANSPSGSIKPVSGFKPINTKPSVYVKPSYGSPTGQTQPTSSFSVKPAAIKGAEF